MDHRTLYRLRNAPGWFCVFALLAAFLLVMSVCQGWERVVGMIRKGKTDATR